MRFIQDLYKILFPYSYVQRISCQKQKQQLVKVAAFIILSEVVNYILATRAFLFAFIKDTSYPEKRFI